MRARSEGGRLAWALVRCAPFGHCGDKIVEERGDLLDALGELQASFPDKPEEWFYRAVYRLLAGKVERVGSEHWLVKGLAELGDTYPLVQSVDPRGKVSLRLLLPSIRVREEGENMHAHNYGYVAPEVAPAPR
ncbi:hypothetical protein [Infirmifilum sp. SLHALR2]|nr:MAG: hypothetical protein B7L53_01450 [Thermofilum sp. NZ13]